MAGDQTAASIDGFVAPGFEPVRRAYEAGFEAGEEVGSACCVYVGAEKKVDLWGGIADPAAGTPWREDTIALTYSATKGATALVVLMLAERGELDLDAPVARYWPEFAAEGKGEVPVRMLMTHRVGLPVVDAELTREEILAGRPVAEALAAQKPIWEPGTDLGYHAFSYGWLLGELVRRITGEGIGEVFARLVAEPLDLDFYIGLPASEEGRVAPLLDPPPDPADEEDEEMDTESLVWRALTTNGVVPTPHADTWNDPELRAAEIPGANGVGDARSLAKMYAACLGEVDGVRLLSAEALADAVREQSSGTDRVLLGTSRWATGFMLIAPESRMLSESSFGHPGAGGTLAYGDRDSGVAFGYVVNQLGDMGTGEEPRQERLAAAIRESIAG